jgi:hypothetical protein
MQDSSFVGSTAIGTFSQACASAGCIFVGLAISTAILLASGVGMGDLAREFGPAIFANPRNLSAVLVRYWFVQHDWLAITDQ